MFVENFASPLASYHLVISFSDIQLIFLACDSLQNLFETFPTLHQNTHTISKMAGVLSRTSLKYRVYFWTLVYMFQSILKRG